MGHDSENFSRSKKMFNHLILAALFIPSPVLQKSFSWNWTKFRKGQPRSLPDTAFSPPWLPRKNCGKWENSRESTGHLEAPLNDKWNGASTLQRKVMEDAAFQLRRNMRNEEHNRDLENYELSRESKERNYSLSLKIMKLSIIQ